MKEEKEYFVYILSSGKNGTLYIGVTSNLVKRILEHKNGKFKGFTDKYNVINLAYYESYQNISDAILREKRLKKWNREWKIKLIEDFNPGWTDLSLDML